VGSLNAIGRPGPRPHLRALTGARFLAALHVVLYHVLAWQGTWFSAVVGTGYVSVNFFFVLSGFILAYTYGDHLIDPREFYAARVARIYPIYVLGLLLAAPFFVRAHINAHTIGLMVAQGAAVLLLVQAHVPNWSLVWNSPSWSLSVEAFFYLLFPFVAPWLLRVKRPRVWTLALWCVLMTTASLFLRFAPPAADGSPGTAIDVLRHSPVLRLPEFTIGVLAARERRTIAWAAWPAALAILAALAISASIPYVLLHHGLLDPLFVVLIVALASGGGLLGRVLATPPLVALGEASYALYIVHVPLLLSGRAIVQAIAPSQLETAAFRAGLIGLMIAASLMAFRFVEWPLRHRLRRALGGGRLSEDVAMGEPSPAK
jgi:peptidoglycan/LPS O-acetylase OafA/YrhL